MRTNLVLHCGSHKVERAAIGLVPVPTIKTEGHVPVNHGWLLDQVESAIGLGGMQVVEQAHALSNDGNQYFGLLQVNRIGFDDNKDYTHIVGVRNSHDQRFAASLVVGHQVFVCDNLAFSGEIKVARRHTTHIMRDLPGLAVRAVGLLAERWTANEKRIEAYKAHEMADSEVHDIVVRALDCGAITTTQLPRVLKEYRAPRHPEFSENRNLWRLFNAVTEIGKETSIFATPKRTVNLHALCDGHVGLLLGDQQANAVAGEAVDAEVAIQGQPTLQN